MSSTELKHRLLQVANEFERSFQIEREQQDKRLHHLQTKLSALRQAYDIKESENEQQARTIDKLKIELELSRRGKSRQDSKDRQVDKELQLLRRQVSALRFEVADKYGELHQLKMQLKSKSSIVASEESEEKSADGGSPKHGDKIARDGDSLDDSMATLPSHLEPYSRVSLFSFARDGNLDSIQSILEPEIDGAGELPAVSTFPSTLGVALSLAVANGHMEICSVLLEHGAETSSVEPCTDRNILHLAAHSGHGQMLKLLLSSSEDASDLLDGVDRNGDTPLHIAARHLFQDCVLVLLRQGADPRATDNSGKTALELVEGVLEDCERPPLMPRPVSLENADEDGVGLKENQSENTSGKLPVDKESIEESAEQKAETALQARSTIAALKDVSSLFWAYSVRANSLYTQHKYHEAKAAYQAAVEVSESDPSKLTASNRATLHYNMARTAVQTNQHTEAVEHCTIALDLKDGVYPNALCQRASSYMALYEYQRAVSDYTQLIALGESGNQVGGKLATDWAPQLARAKQMLARSKDHYAVLDVHPTATLAEIKKSFRKQCLKWHPDKHRGSQDAQARSLLMFKALNEANEVLTDESKRSQYDLHRLTHNLNLYGGADGVNPRRSTTAGFRRYEGGAASGDKSRSGFSRGPRAPDFSYDDWYETFNQTAAKSAGVRRAHNHRSSSRNAQESKSPESRPQPSGASGPTPRTERRSPRSDPAQETGSPDAEQPGAGTGASQRGKEKWSAFRPTNISASLESEDELSPRHKYQDDEVSLTSQSSQEEGFSRKSAARGRTGSGHGEYMRYFRSSSMDSEVDGGGRPAFNRESAAKAARAAAAFAANVGRTHRVGSMEEDDDDESDDVDTPSFTRRRGGGAAGGRDGERDWSGLSPAAEIKMQKAYERLLAERRGTL